MARADDTPWPLPGNRASAWWWLGGVAVALAVGGFVVAFVGTFVLGLFLYYAARPVHRRVSRALDAPGPAAVLTVVLIVVPVLALLAYAGAVAYRELTAVVGPSTAEFVLRRLSGDPETLAAVLRNPVGFLDRLEDIARFQRRVVAVAQTLGALARAGLHLSVAVAVAFFLLRDGARIDAWVRERLLPPDGAGYALFRSIDADLEAVYFGNVLTVSIVTVAAVAIYNAYNFLAPGAVALPVPTLLALLTGLATFVPLVVGKLVYVPAAAYLGWAAVRADASLTFPAGFLVAAFLLLDILPQTVLRPFIAGRTLHTGLVLLAYVLGAALFGWYGLFLGPLIAVVAVQFVAYAGPDLVRGVGVSPDRASDLGSGPGLADTDVAAQGDRTAGRDDDGADADGDGRETEGPDAGGDQTA